MKLCIVDRRYALVPYNLQPQDANALLIHGSALVDALHMLFEHVWTKAMPLRAAPTPAAADALDPDDARLLALLASGVKDQTIQTQLRISERTLTRRVTHLLTHLGATTRFQAGARAAERGWL